MDRPCLVHTDATKKMRHCNLSWRTSHALKDHLKNLPSFYVLVTLTRVIMATPTFIFRINIEHNMETLLVDGYPYCLFFRAKHQIDTVNFRTYFISFLGFSPLLTILGFAFFRALKEHTTETPTCSSSVSMSTSTRRLVGDMSHGQSSWILSPEQWIPSVLDLLGSSFVQTTLSLGKQVRPKKITYSLSIVYWFLT